MRSRVQGWWLALALAAGLAADPAPKDNEIKAVFLLNFLRYTEWPATTFATTNAPIVIGLLGDDPFGAALEQAVAGETAQSRPVILRRGRRLDEVAGCHLLFIGKSENARVAGHLRALGTQPVLTVGETEAFARAGGMITFVAQGNRVAFDIDDAAARRAGLELSAKLLKVARQVRPAPPGGP